MAARFCATIPIRGALYRHTRPCESLTAAAVHFFVPYPPPRGNAAVNHMPGQDRDGLSREKLIRLLLDRGTGQAGGSC